MKSRTRTIVYKYDLPGESLYDTPTVFFTSDFLSEPSFDWVVDWSNSACLSHCATPKCMAGVIVKSPDPARVWRLTGRIDPLRSDDPGYEGRWPD